MTDDLAVNAGVVQGVHASRELPIVWSIFLGSLVNKVICILVVMLLNHFYPPVLTVLLFLGGCYLAYEGADKVIEKILSSKKSNSNKKSDVPEKQKVWGAIKTDFVLSMEIIVLAQTEITGSLLEKSLSLSIVGLAASFLIYGLVAILVKVDDMGLVLVNKGHQKIGMFFVNLTPKMMKGLGILGTTAMFMVAVEFLSILFIYQYIFGSTAKALFLAFFQDLFYLELYQILKIIRLSLDNFLSPETISCV